MPPAEHRSIGEQAAEQSLSARSIGSPASDLWSCLTAETTTPGAAALRWGMDVATLTAAVAEGRLPPRLADLDGDGCWRMAENADPEEVAALAGGRDCHLRGVPPDVAVLTGEWHSHLLDESTDSPTSAAPVPALREIVAWCAAASPDALNVGRDMFVWWCSHDTDDPRSTAERWLAVDAWYRMLRRAGVSHGNPTSATRVMVVHLSHPDTPSCDRLASVSDGAVAGMAVPAGGHR